MSRPAKRARGKRRISMIVAMAHQRVIGRDGDLPWHLPDDLRHFKATTLRHPVLMGRKTFDSILGRLGKALPGRRNLVLSRDPSYHAAGAETFTTLDQALLAADCDGERKTYSKGNDDRSELFVIGGAEIYRLALPFAERLFLTRVDATIDGDTRFPRLDDDWRLVSQEAHPADPRHAYPFTFELWQREAAQPAPPLGPPSEQDEPQRRG